MAVLLQVVAGGGWHGGAWPVWLAFWLVVAAALVWLVVRRRGSGGPGSGGPGGPSGRDRARDILAERFARGDITSEEYRERLAEL